jgi:hypothetical protein
MYESSGIIHEKLRKNLCVLFYKMRFFWYIIMRETMAMCERDSVSSCQRGTG